MLDTWHLFRTGGRPDDVRELAAGIVGGLQVSDAGADLFGVGTEAHANDRLLPGEGAVPLAEILAVVLRDHPGLDTGIEVFGPARPPLETATRCAAALRTVLERAAAAPE